MAVKHIRIIPGKRPKVRPSSVRVRVREDQVQWDCNRDFVVCFEEKKPFKDWHFYRRGHRRSGLPTVRPGRMKYKYTVEVGGHIVDPPDVEIIR